MKSFKLALLTALFTSASTFAATDLPGLESGEVDYPAGNVCVPSDNVVVYNWGSLQPVQFELLAINHGRRDTRVHTLFALQKGYCQMGLILTNVSWSRSNAVPAPTQPGQKILDFSLVLEFSSPRNEAPHDLVLAQSVLIDGAIHAGTGVTDPYETKIFSFMVQ